uniref:Glycosyltransferase family 92 protein n=1 Tax=Macrostomum lignano TaxID=282301 RepID=A0A1I8HKE8_9PLAT
TPREASTQHHSWCSTDFAESHGRIKHRYQLFGIPNRQKCSSQSIRLGRHSIGISGRHCLLCFAVLMILIAGLRFIRPLNKASDSLADVSHVTMAETHEARHGLLVRVVGIALGGRVDGQLCQLWYRRDTSAWYQRSAMVAVPATAEIVPGGHAWPYDYVVISCINPARDREVGLCSAHAVHPVLALPSEPVRNGRFAVCMSPLQSKYDKVDELVQTLELNRLFGADHFFVYKHSTSRRVTELLSNKHFASDVTVLPFQPPLKVDVDPQPPGYVVELKYFGQCAMLQDCLMRAAAQYEFAVFTDMDEVIVPRGERFRSWRDLTRAFMSDGSIGGLAFKNAFFRLEWASDPEVSRNATITGLKLSALLKLRREAEIYSPISRSKMIAQPHHVRILGVHNVWRYFNGRSTEYVKFETAGLHHYRRWGRGLEKKSVRDPAMLLYKEQLIARVLRARIALRLPVQ